MSSFPFANQVLDYCESTNTIARQMAELGAPHGTWISSRNQGAGRGRLGRKWESLEGNLFLSIVARIEDRSRWSWIPLTTAVAATDCLKELWPDLDFRIKWPNDLWLGGAKLGGILCEGVVRGNDSFSVIGIGINCLHSPDLGGLDAQSAIDLTQASHAVGGDPITADSIRVPIIEAILRNLLRLSTVGPSVIAQTYEARAVFSVGTSVQWGSPAQTGTVLGLGPSGELQVRSGEEKLQSLFAEDVKCFLSLPHVFSSKNETI